MFSPLSSINNHVSVAEEAIEIYRSGDIYPPASLYKEEIHKPFEGDTGGDVTVQ